MSAVIVKGIIISLSVVAAVGIALQSPEVKAWLEEQREKLSELLRTVSEGLDPEIRREAEAFAYEGRMPSPREQEGMNSAAAIATGRETEGIVASRGVHRQSSATPVDAEERRRLGREYLARRNQELLDMKKKRESEKETDSTELAQTEVMNEKEPLAITERANSVGSFDHLINTDGSLRQNEKQPQLVETQPDLSPAQELRTAVRAFNAGTFYGNPFDDGFAILDPVPDREATPKPPVPPKVALESPTPSQFSAPLTVDDPPEQTPEDFPAESAQDVQHGASRGQEVSEDLSFDEQLARALSISLAESEAAAQQAFDTVRSEQELVERAIAESLREAGKAIQDAVFPDQSTPSPSGPLVDFSHDRGLQRPSTNPFRQQNDDDELYYLTPAPTGARSVDMVEATSSSTHRAASQFPDIARFLSALQDTPQSPPAYDPLRTLMTSPLDDKSSPPAHDTSTPTLEAAQLAPHRSATLSPSLSARDALSAGHYTESDTDDFASLPDSTAQSEASLIQVEDVDIESMSDDDDDDDGIHTPTSWSDVGSDVGSDIGNSERSESEAGELVRV